MVKRLIIKLIIEVSSTVAKSFMKAYQQSAKQQGGKAGNPFTEFLNQTMQAANLTHKPMTRDEAFKIQINIQIFIYQYIFIRQRLYCNQFQRRQTQRKLQEFIGDSFIRMIQQREGHFIFNLYYIMQNVS